MAIYDPDIIKIDKELEREHREQEKLRKKQIEEYNKKHPEKAIIFKPELRSSYFKPEPMIKTNRTNDAIKEISIYQGRQLRLLRHNYDLSQKQLADVMGVSINQVQKYENGVNRLSSARLYMLAEKIKNGGDSKFNINYFFEGINFKYFETHEGSVFSNNSFSLLDKIASLGLAYENIIINLMRLKNPQNITSIKNLIKKFVKLETFEQKDESGVEKGD